MARLYSRPILVAVALASSLTLGACARQIDSGTYEGPAVGETMQTFQGVVQVVREVEVQERDTLEQSKTGQLIGGVAGGFAGSAIGSGVGQAAAVAAGAILGALVGSLVEQEAKRQPALEYIVETQSGELLTIVQGVQPQIAPGQRVFVQVGRTGRSRIIPAL